MHVPQRDELIDRLKEDLAQRGYELLAEPQGPLPGAIEASAGLLHPFTLPGYGVLYALVPVQVRLDVDAGGAISKMDGGQATEDELDSVRLWLEDLIASHRLEDSRLSAPAPRATHAVVIDAKGRAVVRRRGFDTAGS